MNKPKCHLDNCQRDQQVPTVGLQKQVTIKDS